MSHSSQIAPFNDVYVPDERILSIIADAGVYAGASPQSASNAIWRAIESYCITLANASTMFGDYRGKNIETFGFALIVGGLLGIPDSGIHEFGSLLTEAMRSHLASGGELAGHWGRIELVATSLIAYLVAQSPNPVREIAEEHYRQAGIVA